MKIQQLLIEADLFRFQRRWAKTQDPVIYIKQRPEGRDSSAPALETFGFHYGLTKLGLKLPRRWASTFCTTDPSESTFFSEGGVDEAGVRRIVVPGDRQCGWVVDDFNGGEGGYGISDIVQQYLEAVGDPNLAEDMQQYAQTHRTDDQGYYDFADLMEYADEVANGGTSLTSLIVSHYKALINKQAIGVATVDQLPSNGGVEVWFEGDYEAHKVDGDVE